MKILYLIMLCCVTAFSQVNTFMRLYSLGQGNTIKETNDGGYIIGGSYAQTIQLIKVDGLGFQEWARIYPSSNNSYSSALQANDGNYILAGTKKDASYDNVCLRKISNSGSLVWENIYQLGFSVYGSSIEKTSGGGFILLGITAGFTKKIYLIKTDENGVVQWQREYSVGPATISGSIRQTIDGGFGIQLSNRFIKTNQTGDSLWAKTISGITSFHQSTDSGYVFTGSNKIVKIDQNGNDIWSKTISGTGNSIKQTSDGGYIIAGTMGLLKTNSQGDEIWTKSVIGIPNSIEITDDGGFILVGRYNSYIMAAKTNNDGDYTWIIITSTLDGQTLYSGFVREISWIKTNVDYVKIEYSTNNGADWNLVATNIIADSCKYEWIVPYQISHLCKLKISDVNNPSVFDMNIGVFSIINIFGRYNYIAANQIKMWIGNDGSGSHDPITGGNGFFWPGGENATQSAIYQDGLVWGGVVSGQIRFNGNTHRQGLQPGKIIGHIADDPGDPIYRIWKIKKGWENLPPGLFRDSLEYHYNNWPGYNGAPYIDVNGDGIFTPGVDLPKYYGDETLWYVANDLDSIRTARTYGSPPIGLEFQTTVFGYDTSNTLSDVVFKKYKILNKSINFIDSMYFGYWSDSDLGDANDDYTGCDTLIQLGYTYNATNNDMIYGISPPAVGYVLLQGPTIPANPADSAMFDGRWIKGKRNLPMTAFTFYINPHSTYRDPSAGTYQGTLEFYNYLNGYVWNGNPFIDPITGAQTKFVLSGDPVTGTGWYEGPGWPGGPYPGDRRHVMCFGPVNMAPGDSQEVVIAIVIARGTSNINSITKLKQLSQYVKTFYVSNLITGVEEIKEVPKEFSLLQNYPNPFNPNTIINYQLPNDTWVTLKVYDILGREIATLVNEQKQAGSHHFEFRTSDFGIPSGVYIYRLTIKNDHSILFSNSKKMVLIK